MVGNNTRFLALLFIGGLLLTNIACNQETLFEPADPNFTILPPLTDEIPYDVLGQGKLVFRRDGFIYVIDIDAQTSWGIDVFVYSPVVSPDGEKIAYTAGAGYDAGTLSDVFIMNIDGTSSENVSEIPGVDRRPSWTHDSGYVLFYVVWHPELPYVSLFRQSPIPNPSDRVLIQKFIAFSGLEPGSPVNVSVSNNLVFSDGLFGAGTGIHTMNMDGSGLATLTPPRPNSTTWYYSPSFSPNGEEIAYLSATRPNHADYESLEIVVIDADGSNPSSLGLFEIGSGQTLSFAEVAYGNGISLCWSPDGSKIAFTILEGNLVSHIYVINSDGTGLTQITSAEGVTDNSLSWSN